MPCSRRRGLGCIHLFVGEYSNISIPGYNQQRHVPVSGFIQSLAPYSPAPPLPSYVITFRSTCCLGRALVKIIPGIKQFEAGDMLKIINVASNEDKVFG